LLRLIDTFLLIGHEPDLVYILFPDRLDRINNASVVNVNAALDVTPFCGN